ncbi:MAG: hypothetical protein AB1512_32105 [Thermodesulfobacteriota bacterium]
MALLTLDEFEGKGFSEPDLRAALREEARKLLGIAVLGEPPGGGSLQPDPVLLRKGKDVLMSISV